MIRRKKKQLAQCFKVRLALCPLSSAELQAEVSKAEQQADREHDLFFDLVVHEMVIPNIEEPSTLLSSEDKF